METDKPDERANKTQFKVKDGGTTARAGRSIIDQPQLPTKPVVLRLDNLGSALLVRKLPTFRQRTEKPTLREAAALAVVCTATTTSIT